MNTIFAINIILSNNDDSCMNKNIENVALYLYKYNLYNNINIFIHISVLDYSEAKKEISPEPEHQ